MDFIPRYARAVDWNLSGVRSGQGIGKTLSTAQNVAKQVNRSCD